MWLPGNERFAAKHDNRGGAVLLEVFFMETVLDSITGNVTSEYEF